MRKNHRSISMDGCRCIFPPEASRQSVRIEYTEGKIDVRETSRGRHRDEVRSLTLFSSSMRAIPYRSVFGKRTNERTNDRSINQSTGTI